MENEIILKSYHRVNIFIWLSILIFIVILTMVTFMLDEAMTFIPVESAAQVNQVMFLLAVVIAFAILFFKRSLFVPGKIAEVPFELATEEKNSIVFKRLRKNYIIVWAMGEAIALMGFINYVLTADRQYFMVFAVVSLYSVLINIPRIAIAEKCIELTRQDGPVL